MSFSTASEF